MKKIYLLVFTLMIVLMGILNFDKVSALECFQICYDDQCIYKDKHTINTGDGLTKYDMCVNDSGDDDDYACFGRLKFTTVSVSGDSCSSYTPGPVSSILNDKVSCGKLGKFNKKIPEITSWVVTIIQIIVPIILVILGSIDFVKGITSQKDDEIKKGQQIFIKRLIVAVIIFFVVAITKLLVGLISSGQTEKDNIVKCIECFISNDCD